MLDFVRKMFCFLLRPSGNNLSYRSSLWDDHVSTLVDKLNTFSVLGIIRRYHMFFYTLGQELSGDGYSTPG